MSERLSLKRVIVPALAIAIGVSACGGGTVQETTRKDTHSETINNDGDIQITTIYTPTGKRFTHYQGLTSAQKGFNDTLAYCDGHDMVEQVSQYLRSAGGAAISRSVNHPACVDGQLTPTDFAILK